MRKISQALVLAGVVTLPVLFSVPSASAADAAAASPHTFTGNATLASEYIYRGIAQTRGKPAIQGGFDYAHASGFYAGVWGSSISWIGDAVPGASANVEVDVYGGYKGSISDDLGYDVGVLTYNYPGSGKTLNGTILDQDTTELYAAMSWKWLTLKYSHSTTALFGWAKTGTTLDKTTGSSYLEANAAYDLGNGWGINGHVGHQKVKGNTDASYSDYKLGATKDMGFGVFGLAYSTTNAKDNCSGTAAATANDVYCYVNNNSTDAYSAGKGRVLLTFGKTF
ncbi:MAG: TorF family putative porin [Gammaproteobacteria bacterium]|nr:TorF family putative porin [Gammaproteobacteria bacterium]MBU1979003.1 TorF family putative porin [Gammaproteobacteria bacterium]